MSTGRLLMHLLQVDINTGESANIFESDGLTKIKVYHWNTWQANDQQAIVYHVIGKHPNRCKSGISKVDDVQIQITVWHPDSMEAATIAANIRTVLEGWKGSFDNVDYYQTLFDNEVESWEDKLNFYGVIQTWTISHAR